MFGNIINAMKPKYQQLYLEGISGEGDKNKQAQFIINYTKESFWMLQSFLIRMKQLALKMEANVNSDAFKIAAMEDPLTLGDAI